MGLATSYSIIKNHGGIIDVITKPDEGTTFNIYLPASPEAFKPIDTPDTDLKKAKARRVLLRDDDENLRNLSRQLLTFLGHDVEVTSHGQETLEKYQEAMAAGTQFDVVILDLTIRGGMGGEETMQNLLAINPTVKAIVSSGYSDDASMANQLEKRFKACLKKPYGLKDLANTLNSVIA